MTNIFDTIRYEIKNWWLFLVVGLFSLMTGIVVFARPVAGYVSLSILFSTMMVCSGFGQIFFATSVNKLLKGWGWTLVSGIVDLALGTYLMMHPVITMVTLPYFVGFYLIFRAFYLMGSSFDLKAIGVNGWGWLLGGGFILLGLGFLTLYYPAAGMVGIVVASGSAFIVSGLLSIVLAFQLKNLKHIIEKPADLNKMLGASHPNKSTTIAGAQ